MCDLGTCFHPIFVLEISLLVLVLLQAFHASLFEVQGEASCGPDPSVIKPLQVAGRGERLEERE